MFVAAFSDDRDCDVLRGLWVVLVDEPAETVASCDRVSGRERNDGWWPVGWVEVAPAVWPLVIAVVDVGLEHASEVHFAEDQDAVEALGADGADESLGVRVGLRATPRCAEDLDAFGAEDLIEPVAMGLAGSV